MKRAISLFCVFVLVVVSSIAPISADTVDQITFDNSDDYSTYPRISGGVIRDESEIDYYYVPDNGKNQMRLNLPSSVDLSTDMYFPTIGNQGVINSCSGWGATYYQFGYQVARMKGWNAKNNTNYQFSPKWTYNLLNDGSNEGVDIMDTYNILKKFGAVRYSEFTPAVIGNINSSGYETELREWCTDTQAMRNALNYRLDTKTTCTLQEQNNFTDTPITSYNSPRLEDMKSRLNNGQILTFSTEIIYNGLNTDTLSNQYLNNLNGQEVLIKNSNILYYIPSQYLQNNIDAHFFTIVGYDDNIWYDLNQNGTEEDYEKGAFKVADSQGTGKWNNGFIWMLYDSINKVSNASTMNSLDRISTMREYRYYAITVKECPVDLTVEVTVQQSQRKQTRLSCLIAQVDSMSSIDPNNIASNSIDAYITFLNCKGGEYNFSGTGCNAETATFVFDYNNFEDDYKTAYYGLGVVDDTINTPTVINKIQIVDSEGNVIYTDNETKIVDADLSGFGVNSYFFTIGLLGDVDLDKEITIMDVGKIQMYLAGLVSYSESYAEYKLADVDRDGYITSMDALRLQRYIAGLCDIGDSCYISLD